MVRVASPSRALCASSVTYDNVPPTLVSLVRASTQAATSNVSPVVFNATFSEPVFGVTSGLFR